MGDAKSYREIEIIGSLLHTFVPRGGKYGYGGHCTVTVCTTVDRDVIAAIDAAEAAGAARLLLVVDSFGGEVHCAHAVAARVRRFSSTVGPVVAFVRKADSSAPAVALEADFVVLAADGRFLVHGAVGEPGGDPQPTHETMAAALAARTGMDARLLMDLMNDGPGRGYRVDGDDALRWGFADEIGTLERARELATGADLPETNRARRIAARRSAAQTSSDVDPVATMSSESTYNGTFSLSPGARDHEAAARNWIARTAPGVSLRAVAHSGLVWCAVGSSGCATSSNAVAWTSQTIPAGDYESIAWNGSVFCAVGDGVCATSPDGSAWTARTIGTGTWAAVAWNGSVFCAVGRNGYSATSPTGTTWTSHASGPTSATGIRGLAWSDYLSTFCAVGGGAVYTSPDGSTWTARSGIGSAIWKAVAWNGSTFCAVAEGGYSNVSADGITWGTAALMPQALGAARYATAIVWTGYVFVAVEATAGVTAAAVYTSRDGRVWAVATDTMPNATGYLGLAWNGSLLVAVYPASIATSMAV